MLKKFNHNIIVAGILFFGIGIVNSTLIKSAKATHQEEMSQGKTEEAERADSKEEREKGGTYDMGYRGEIKEEGKMREQKAKGKSEDQKEEGSREGSKGGHGY